MIARESVNLLLLSIGNTRTRCARTTDGQLEPSRVVENHTPAALIEEIHALIGAFPDDTPVVAMIASVNQPISEQIVSALALTRIGGNIVRFGADLPIPIEDALEDRSTVGQDRLFNALGAYATTEQACVVIDAGTAITVDFVDGAGVFQGGAIAPGVQMMLDALHANTDALPPVTLPREDPISDGPFGKTTPEAMLHGAVWSARGLARALIDRYAEYYQAYPMVVATGGDAPRLFEDDPLVERVVPDLPIVGMLAAHKRLAELTGPNDEDERA